MSIFLFIATQPTDGLGTGAILGLIVLVALGAVAGEMGGHRAHPGTVRPNSDLDKEPGGPTDSIDGI
jgi:hypothetical protein